LERDSKESDGAGSSGGEVVRKLRFDVGDNAGFESGSRCQVHWGQNLATGRLSLPLGGPSGETFGLGLANPRVKVELCGRPNDNRYVLYEVLEDRARGEVARGSKPYISNSTWHRRYLGQTGSS
jgi:hypothetical protein